MADNIIVTGANQGIGYYMVEKLLAEGNKVSVLDIETDNLANLKKKYDGLIFYKTDLRNYDEVKRAVDETVAECATMEINCFPFANSRLFSLSPIATKMFSASSGTSRTTG